MANRYTLKTGGIYTITDVRDGTSARGPWQFTKVEVPNDDPSKKPRIYTLWTSEAPHTLGKGDSVMITSLTVTDGWKKKEDGTFAPDISYSAMVLPVTGQSAPTAPAWQSASADDEASLPF